MSFAIRKMECEHRVAPVGIGNPVPRFSWQSEVCVYAYRIWVKKGAETVWDSGRVNKEDYFAVYGGSPLEIATRYDWSLTLWDREGREQTAVSFFETGLFSVADWKGGWLSAKKKEEPLYVRTEFQVKEEIASARLLAAGTAGAFGWTTLSMNCLSARLNGKDLSDDFLAFGRISPKKGRAVYRMYDVTALLKAGANALSVISLSAAFGFCLILEKRNGEREWRTFDHTDFKASYGGPLTLWEFGVNENGGKNEYYDSRRDWKGWELPAFDDSDWSCAVPAQTPSILCEQPAPATRAELVLPKRMWKNSYRRYVADFGTTLHGHLRLHLAKGNPAKKITVRYAEGVYPDGELDYASTVNFMQGEIGPQRDIYIPREEEDLILEPRFANHGFRYAEVLHYQGTPEEGDIAAWKVVSPLGEPSRFSCSDEQINKLYQMSCDTQKANLATIPSDCPHRERLGWLGDALCVAEAECLNFDLRAFFEGYWNCIEDEQEENGNVNYIAPLEGGGRVDIPWSAACVMIPWYTYDVYGDKTVLARAYPAMMRWIAYMDTLKTQEGLIAGGVRWNDHTAKEKPDNDFMGSLYYYLSVYYTGKTAEALGKDGTDCFEKAKAVKETVLKKYWNGAGFGNNLQAENAVPLGMGMLSGETEQAALNALVARLEEDEGRITCGCLGIHNLIPALADRGYNNLVLDFCKDTRAGSWGGWIQNVDATTAFEYLTTDIIRSKCHPFLMGSINTWFYEHLLGVKRTSAGFKTFRIAPFIPEDLIWAEGTQNTCYGPIAFRWEKKEGGVEYTLDVPCGTEATVFSPKGEPRQARAGRHVFRFSE